MDLKNQLLENTRILIETVQKVSDSMFNIQPDENSWSVAQVVEHLYCSEFGISKLFKGETEKEIGRAPDAHVEEMRERFLESEQKMKASGVILPTDGDKSKDDLLSKFQQNRIRMAELIDNTDLNELCLSFKHPVFGYLTRLEWIHFNIIHTQKHLRQIERITSEIH